MTIIPKTMLRQISYALLLMAVAASAQARDDVGDYSIEDALAMKEAKQKLDQGIAFYFAGQSHPEAVEKYGIISTSQKTNSFGKSDTEACHWVFLSAMIQLQERALQEGANAVVDIKSNYNDIISESADTFRCGAGNIMAGVALQGRMVELPE